MGSYRTYAIPSKPAGLVPEFAAEDLPLAELPPSYSRGSTRDLLDGSQTC